jgi:hypothetical protein
MQSPHPPGQPRRGALASSALLRSTRARSCLSCPLKQEHAARPADLRPDDVVLGEFLGDQELLVLGPSEAGQRRILVVLPLDGRDDWLGAAQDLGGFLDRYIDHAGDKYWERPDVEAEPEAR